MLLAPIPGGPGAQNEKNMESVLGSYSNRALSQLGVWASVSSAVNFEPGSRSGSAARLSTAVTMFFPLNMVLQAAMWSLRRKLFL